MKFGFIMLGDYSHEKDNAKFPSGEAEFYGVGSLEEAEEVVKQLKVKGIECIELCGAFKETGAKRIINATDNEIPIGYVTHLPEQNAIYKKVFNE